MAAAYFFASPLDVEIKLEGEELRKQVEIKSEKDRMISCPVYYDGESVSGQVCRPISRLKKLFDCLRLLFE
jgi:vacuolar protein sorting-associated protein 26